MSNFHIHKVLFFVRKGNKTKSKQSDFITFKNVFSYCNDIISSYICTTIQFNSSTLDTHINFFLSSKLPQTKTLTADLYVYP